MSSFMVSNQHIAAIVGTYLHMASASVYTQREVEGIDGTEIAKMLYKENLRATDFRYGNETGSGNADAVADFTAAYAAHPVTRGQIAAWREKPLTPGQLFKALDCYGYQCAEPDDYENTEAVKFCRRLRSMACSLVDGYEATPWTINEPPPVRLEPVRRLG